MINNPKAARIVAVVVIAMLVITLAASLFGCAAAKPAATSSTDPESGLTFVAATDLPGEARDTLKLIDQADRTHTAETAWSSGTSRRSCRNRTAATTASTR